MSNEPLPPGIAEGERAYVLVDHPVTGVGSYHTTHRVTVDVITATQVRVVGNYSGGGTTVFPRRTLVLKGTGGKYSDDDTLVPADDPRVAVARRTAEVYAALDAFKSGTREALQRVQRVGAVHVANDDEVVSQALHDLTLISEAASTAARRLRG
jgi:hypothetical protein